MQASRIEIVEKVLEVLRDATEDPGAELIRIGNALAEVGEALKGRSVKECQGIMTAVEQLV